MRPPTDSQNTASKELLIPPLTAEVEEALAERAHRNGRTVDEEAEHIIKAHLAETDREIGESIPWRLLAPRENDERTLLFATIHLTACLYEPERASD